ncbi:MAG: response regulator [Patescibacteria group bacterium]|nr:response regulator [Patescibacteria group bacterium]
MNKILIIEDDILLSEVYQKSIQAEGFAVDVVRDYKQALDKFNPKRQSVIILDIMLRGKNGFEVLKAIRRRQGGDKVKIIVVTGMNTDDLRLNDELLVGLNIVGIYTKSQFSIAQLIESVKGLMKQNEAN